MTLSANRASVWLGLIVALAVSIGGYLVGWYQAIGWYDSFTHALVSAAVSYAAGVWLYGKSLTGAEESPGALVLTVVCIGVALGVGWEMLEFAYDHLTGPRSLILPKADTLADLGWDGLGSVAGGIGVRELARARPRVRA